MTRDSDIANPSKVDGAEGADLSRARVVCCIPARDEAQTIFQVVRVVDEGLVQARPASGHILLGDSACQDDTEAVFQHSETQFERSVVRANAPGKGRILHDLLVEALRLESDYIAFFDADVTSSSAAWVPLLVAGCHETGSALALPAFSTSQGGPLNNLVARPLLGFLTDSDVPQPAGGEMCFSREFASALAATPLPDAATGYGIDIHVALAGLRETDSVSVVGLGAKVHRPREWSSIFGIVQEVFEAAQQNYRQHGQWGRGAVVHTIASATGVPRPKLIAVDAARLRDAGDQAERAYQAAMARADSAPSFAELVTDAKELSASPTWWAGALVELLTSDDTEQQECRLALEVLFMHACAHLAEAYRTDPKAGPHAAEMVMAAIGALPASRSHG